MRHLKGCDCQHGFVSPACKFALAEYRRGKFEASKKLRSLVGELLAAWQSCGGYGGQDPEDFDSYQQLMDRAANTIAGGEHVRKGDK